MKVQAKELDWNNLPENVRPFVSKSQTFISARKEYEVYAVSLYRKVLFCLVVDDLGAPEFLPCVLFVVMSKTVPHDWICSAQLDEDVDLVLGPEFIARDLLAYSAMIDHETQALDLFWDRVTRGPEAG
ncbi:MAG: hypothetical protein R3B06_00205 [Kofleriaceae bacterium]